MSAWLPECVSLATTFLNLLLLIVCSERESESSEETSAVTIVCVYGGRLSLKAAYMYHNESKPLVHHILCQFWESLQSTQLDILLPKYIAMLEQMSNYPFKWVGLYALYT